ncbi:MAG TPA: prepilin-type N-terminal cleavage/methylation domain-containing protein [Candidatus Saccharimonadia bacterium]|nr:prepilin-type N-terminal cleavage/methylation domain-containing protein [Candidatus Saccharimonadia bacterium]
MSIASLKKQGGFTLLELLIVIVIIGILALLIIPNITSAPKKARDTKRKTDITTLRKGLEEYFVNNNVYPASSGAVGSGTVLSELSSGTAPIVKTLPTDPKNTGVYVYTYTPANSDSTYTLKACLENDQDSGASVSTDSSCGSASAKKFEVVNGN